jgi:peptidoglycan/xylan/chitin deacetylase (PgdA/CDA1 family)
MSFLAAFLLSAAATAAAVPDRRVAVTIDDLPGPNRAVVKDAGGDLAAFQAMTAKLLAALKASGTPAIGFVNEDKLAPGGEVDPARVGLLEAWRDAGMELGNHTYSHPDLHRTELADFERDVVRGEETTKTLLAARGKTLRYFRHPFLHTGRKIEVKRALEKFLSERGYAIAPVTHDNGEWIFAVAYAIAGNRGDAAGKDTQKRIAEAYVPYMDAKFDYFERESKALFGREIPQVLLIHANSLNSDVYPDLARRMKARGYRFVSLGEALEDPAFRSPDTFTGAGGISWLHRWALTRGGKGLVLPDEPMVPKFVLDLAGVDGE